jgi:hypothetical protein
MRRGSRPPDEALLRAWFDDRLAAANSAKRTGDLFLASRRYAALLADFDGLLDLTAVERLAAELGAEPQEP